MSLSSGEWVDGTSFAFLQCLPRILATTPPLAAPEVLRHLTERSATTGQRLTTALELLVNFHLIARDQAVSLVGHAHDCHQFFEHGVGHTFLLRGRGMRCNAVV